MAHDEEKLPMIAHHMVTRLQDRVVIFGGTPVICSERDLIYTPNNQDEHTIWTCNLHTDLWTKYVISKDDETPPLLPGSTAVTINTDIYMFAALKDDLGILWRLNRNRKGCFSWHEVAVKKSPSYRHDMTAWQYSDKIWILGGCGPSPADVGHLNNFVEFGIPSRRCYAPGGVKHVVNNQLLRFDPSCSEWANLKCSGATVPLSQNISSTVMGYEAWLYSDSSGVGLGELYNLNMRKLSWTQIQFKQSIPKLPSATLTRGFTGTCSKLVLHGLSECETSKITWILDLSSLSWRKHKTIPQITKRDEKCISGLNSCVLIGGFEFPENRQNYESILLITLGPKNLKHLAMKSIYEHKATLPWKALPDKLFYDVMDISPEDVSDAGI